MINNQDEERILSIVRNIHRNLGIIVAILLLLNQLTIVGIYVTPKGFRFILGGPIVGNSKLESKTGNQLVNLTLYGINLITAKLLIKNEFFVSGSGLTPKGFTINVAGPLIGLQRVNFKLPDFLKDHDNFHDVVSEQFNLDKSIVNKYRKDDHHASY